MTTYLSHLQLGWLGKNIKYAISACIVIGGCVTILIMGYDGMGASNSRRALVLNATYEPIAVVSSRRALLLVIATKAELIHPTSRFYRSESFTFPEPSIVRLSHYVRVPHDRGVALNRRTLFARDHGRCQYCGKPAESIDHVVPRSKGGRHSWDNVVAACKYCNMRKTDRLPHEVGFVLAKTPTVPKRKVWLIAVSGNTPEEWMQYLDEESLSA